MTQQRKSKLTHSGKRRFLAGTAISGVTSIAGWMKPTVDCVVLPSHAATTSPPVITSAAASETGCRNAFQVVFEITYAFTSVYGVVSHVVTASCEGSDTIAIADGQITPGVNLLDQIVTDDSLSIEGTEFAGSVFINDTLITDQNNSSSQSCVVTITLTDENGGEAVETLNLVSNCGD